MNKNYASAAVTLKYIKNADAVTDYLKAILAARMGNKADIQAPLSKAIAADSWLKNYAANDLELTK